MNPVATREPAAAERGSAELPAPRLFEPQGPTLEGAILATWHELATAGEATCPVCGEFVLHEGALVRCPECAMRLHGRIDRAGTGVQSGSQAG